MQKYIAYQGEPGANSEAAIEQYFGSDAEALPCQRFSDVFEAVVVGSAVYGMVPIENSITGSIAENLDLLRKHNLYITGETVLQIQHHLLGLAGTVIDDIAEVHSHPQGLLQCRSFLDVHSNIRPIAAEDTAGAARQVAEWKIPERAAIANASAGVRYGLEVICPDIGDRHDNFTRFIVLSSQLSDVDKADKVSMVFEVEHRPAALYDALGVFAEGKINLTKIESRPIPEKAFNYWFYVECEGLFYRNTRKRLEADLRAQLQHLKILGWYCSEKHVAKKEQKHQIPSIK
ncbi:prephenate dehydratase [bacterium]|nr:prephenate dehydratase [bacterium]